MLSINLVRSEWRKIATTPGIRRGLFGAYLLRVAFCLLMALAIPTDELTRLHSHDMVELVIKASRVTHILLAIIAASAVAMEYKSGQITRTLTWSPSRIVLIPAKAIAMSFAVLIEETFAIGTCYLIAKPILQSRHIPFSFHEPGTSRMIVMQVIVGIAFSLIGQLLGWTIRNTMAPALIVIGAPIVEQLMTLLPFDLIGFITPMFTLDRIRSLDISFRSPRPIPFDTGLISLAILTSFFALLIALAVSRNRSDIPANPG
jgi:hypothetical protein